MPGGLSPVAGPSPGMWRGEKGALVLLDPALALPAASRSGSLSLKGRPWVPKQGVTTLAMPVTHHPFWRCLGFRACPYMIYEHHLAVSWHFLPHSWRLPHLA